MNTVANDHSFQQEETGLSRVEYAYRKIKNNITSNVFTSGFQMLEPELAENLGVSRTPVREALIRLEADNLIQLIPRRGMRVLPLTAKDIVELTEAVNCVLSAAIKSICAHGRNANLEKAAQHLISLSREAQSEESAEWVNAEDKFCMSLMSLSGNYRLKATAENYMSQLRRGKFLVLNFVNDKTALLHCYRALLKALEMRDEAAALSAIGTYQRQFLNLFYGIQERYQLREF